MTNSLFLFLILRYLSCAMNGFKKRRISKRPTTSIRKKNAMKTKAPKTPREPRSISHFLIDSFQQHYVWGTILLVSLVALGKMTINVAANAEDFTVTEIVLSAFAEKVQMDKNDHTNILLLGTGTEEHDGANLTDTIIIASIDHNNHLISMLSIPRDFYIEIPELYGGNRINTIFELLSDKEIDTNNISEKQADHLAYLTMMHEIGNLLDIDLHYYARINFDGFSDIVDALGGIDLYVENDLYDPFYPAEDGTIGYQLFALKAGPQHLDGDAALKYVRSRKTTSDFDRAARQQQTINAIKEKALSVGVLANPNKLKNIYSALQANFDTNLKWDEITYLAKIATKFDRNSLQSWVLNDNPLTEGGFLYTPEREFYQGAFVLVPYIYNGEDLQRFAELTLHTPEAHANPLTYQILNGTGANGIATTTMYYIGRFGYDVVRFGNAANQGVQKTRIIPRSLLLNGQSPEDAAEHPQLKELHKKFLPVGEITQDVPPEYAPEVWTSQADVIIELGSDYVNWMNANPKYFY